MAVERKARVMSDHPDNARKRAWDQAKDRRSCPCGNLRAPGQQRKHPDGLCMYCRLEVKAVEAAIRRERIVEFWAEGLSRQQIADRLGTSDNAIGKTMAEMRREGWDLPYRYRWTPEKIDRQRQVCSSIRRAA